MKLLSSKHIGIYYTLFFGGLIVLFITLMTCSKTPEEQILGVWKEVAWKYEKVDHKGKTEDTFHIDEQKQREISKELVIHEAEIWEFQFPGRLLFHKENGPPHHLNWRLKGRGHILQLTGANGAIEHYQVQKLTENQLELHFNIDLQARGVVKMIFEKSKN